MGTPLSSGTPGRISSDDIDLKVRKPKSISTPTAAATMIDRPMFAPNSWRSSGIMMDILIDIYKVAKFGKAQLSNVNKMAV